MHVTSITKIASVDGPRGLAKLAEEFDYEVNERCRKIAKEAMSGKRYKIIDVDVQMSQGGTANWQGGVHTVLLNCIIKFEEKEQ